MSLIDFGSGRPIFVLDLAQVVPTLFRDMSGAAAGMEPICY